MELFLSPGARDYWSNQGDCTCVGLCWFGGRLGFVKTTATTAWPGAAKANKVWVNRTIATVLVLTSYEYVAERKCVVGFCLFKKSVWLHAVDCRQRFMCVSIFCVIWIKTAVRTAKEVDLHPSDRFPLFPFPLLACFLAYSSWNWSVALLATTFKNGFGLQINWSKMVSKQCETVHSRPAIPRTTTAISFKLVKPGNFNFCKLLHW